jgi:hypothetical protein
MNILEQYINPLYLDPKYITTLKETVKTKPISKYLVLDNFFKKDVLDSIIEEHQSLYFDDKIDRIDSTGQLLAYDGALAGCNPNSLLGKLLYSPEWHSLLLDLLNMPSKPKATEIKLRQHRNNADGFWLHSDAEGGGGGARDLVAIAYYNKEWAAENGGLLQLWRLDESSLPDTPYYTHEDGLKGQMKFLEQPRIKVSNVALHTDEPCDFVLVDQVLPVYNRIFLCNFQEEPAYHSVTPSRDRVREGFVQWLLPMKP